ncbi:MAG: addiction module protein [Mucilaginibacter sp.]
MIQMQEIMEMSVAERILMIEKIWDSIDHNSIETPASHQEELDRRLVRFEKGETTFYSWSYIKKELSASTCIKM